ncbi:hypothetical protein [Streptomyces sp. DH1]|uniref:hypothetical protein n=1 Tax=Streptomyces sp. DH1 TaxID=2857012 RepID=UPI001E571319|nr:hypothetical protein [Streptomyces sp. DH1]
MSDEPNVRVRVHKESGQPLSAEELASLQAELDKCEPVSDVLLLSLALDDLVYIHGGRETLRKFFPDIDEPKPDA